ncbi:hypothetical protein ETB97_007257 [Aspergillus alliaceus]|uniref:Uncharacterized protein n=1 Tax=Petromyces alliaceus TaxID=209559 RepID=A0A8H6E229_PETAA|nr:hypothetical protein ETB97_007257 [Aspergillus burnettii]
MAGMNAVGGMMEKTRTGTGGGRRRRGRRLINTAGSAYWVTEGKPFTLGVDDLDVGAVSSADLGKRDIGGTPGDKVPEIETELGGISVNCGLVDTDSGPGCMGRGGSGLGDGDGGSQRRKRDA